MKYLALEDIDFKRKTEATWTGINTGISGGQRELQYH